MYVDASWADDRIDRKSISGMTVLFAGSVVSWHSRKQQNIARSTLQAEYLAMDEGMREVL